MPINKNQHILLAGILIFIIAAIVWAPTASAQTQMGALDIEMYTDKAFYMLGDRIGARIALTNKLIEPLQVNLELLVYPKTNDPLNVDVVQDPLYRERWRTQQVNPGGQEVLFNQNSQDLFKVPGVYPVRVIATGRGDQNILADMLSYLIILDAQTMNKPKLRVSFILPISYYPSRGPDGVFLDSTLYEMLRPESPDGLPQISQTYANEKNARFNLSIPAALVDELSSAANGFEFYEGRDKKKLIGADAPESGSAKAILERLRDLVKKGNAEIMTPLYASTPLPLLIDLKWQSDAGGQWIKAVEVMQKASLMKESMCFYNDSAETSPEDIKFLQSQNVKTTTVRSEAFQDLPRGGAYKQNVNDADLVLLVDDAQTSSVFGQSPTERNLQQLWALLAQKYLSDTDETIIINPRSWQPTGAYLSRLFSRLETTTWIETVTAVQSTQKKTEDKTLKFKAGKASTLTDQIDSIYGKRLSDARHAFQLFSDSVRGNVSAKDKMQDWIFAAEAMSLLSKDSKAIYRYRYIDAVNTQFADETKGIRLSAEPTLTLSGMSGRIPFAVINKNSYPSDLVLEYEGTNIEFAEGQRERVTIQPKENIFTKNIQAKASGKSPVTIKLLIGDEVLDTLTISVKTTNFNRTAATVIGIILIVIMSYLYNRRVKGRVN